MNEYYFSTEVKKGSEQIATLEGHGEAEFKNALEHCYKESWNRTPEQNKELKVEIRLDRADVLPMPNILSFPLETFYRLYTNNYQLFLNFLTEVIKN